MEINIPSNAKIAVSMLLQEGFQAGVVGGCTRDSIMGRCPKDWDICTSATPEEIQEVFKDFKQLTMGLKHGTVVIIMNKENLEITTFRIDGEYSDGRRPNEVIFTEDLVNDLSRRDFTQNAIFYNEVEGIIDPFKGQEDIEKKIIRCVGNPSIRLKEDALRILRGIRFAATLGFNIEENTKKAMFENQELLKNVSKERIIEEFIKTIQGENASKILDEFKEIIMYIIPEFKYYSGEKSNEWQEKIKDISKINELMLKIVILFEGIKDEVNLEELFRKIKITNAKGIDKKSVKDILELIDYYNLEVIYQEECIKELLKKLKWNKIQVERLLTLKSIKNAENFNEIKILANEILAKEKCISLKNLKLNGKDLMELGIQGPKIGKILNKLLEDVIDEKLINEKEVLLKAVKKQL